MLDDKGRCCGRKPLHYKGGSWRSPPGAPLLFCCECCREYDPATKAQKASWAWREISPGAFERESSSDQGAKR
jgi:hypothetical protein